MPFNAEVKTPEPVTAKRVSSTLQYKWREKLTSNQTKKRSTVRRSPAPNSNRNTKYLKYVLTCKTIQLGW